MDEDDVESDRAMQVDPGLSHVPARLPMARSKSGHGVGFGEDDEMSGGLGGGMEGEGEGELTLDDLDEDATFDLGDDCGELLLLLSLLLGLGGDDDVLTFLPPYSTQNPSRSDPTCSKSGHNRSKGTRASSRSRIAEH